MGSEMCIRDRFMIERLLESNAPAEAEEDENQEETGDEMKLTSLQSITDFMTCAGKTLPDNIRLWTTHRELFPLC